MVHTNTPSSNTESIGTQSCFIIVLEFFWGGQLVTCMVCVSMWCMCIHVCKYICVAQREISGVLLYPLDLIPSRWCLSLNLERGWQLACPVTHVYSSTATRLQVHNVVLPCLLLRAGNSHLVFCVCTAIPDSTEPSPKALSVVLAVSVHTIAL